MAQADPKAALSAVETELLRDLRSRLNRMPPGKDARGVLAGAFFKACARVGLEPREDAPSDPVTGQLIANVATRADLDALRGLVSVLAAVRRAHPDAFMALFVGGAGQAVLTRRLVLAGREQPRVQEDPA